jgi:cytochrome c553
MMRGVLKWTALVLGAIVALLLVAVGVLYVVTERGLRRTYAIEPEPVAVPADPASIARGAHVAAIRGCTGCHAESLSGQVLIDVPPLARLSAPNLTPGLGGVVGHYDVSDWVRSVRHGVGTDGKPLLLMPSHELWALSDDDLGVLIAYIRQVPAVQNETPANSVRPLGRLLYALGKFPLVPAELIDHGAPRPRPPAPGPTAEYGAYLVATCTGCHGAGLSGGPIPGAPPDPTPPRNLTPDPETGLGRWSEADFFRAMREGRRPDGAMLSDAMPWRAFAQMSDDELRALWLHLRSVPAQAEGNR